MRRIKLRLPDAEALEKEEREQDHFAKGLNFYKLFCIFFIGCIVGVVVEVLWCLATRHYYESRVGLIYGPFNLVYGFGALAMAVGLYWMRHKRDFTIFWGGVVIGSVIEYICSWVQEIMFGSISWNYTSFPFNLDGRINLLYSFFWGILAIIWIKFIYPLMMKGILRIPNRVGKVLTWVLLVFMVFNTVMSALAVERWAMRREGKATDKPIWEYFDKHFPDEKMQDTFPNMIFVE
ncbi:MAG: putative ABC transporter permease [Cellulosilyticaceae bacterium]